MIAGKEEIERQKVFGRDHFVYEENSYFIDVNDVVPEPDWCTKL